MRNRTHIAPVDVLVLWHLFFASLGGYAEVLNCVQFYLRIAVSDRYGHSEDLIQYTPAGIKNQGGISVRYRVYDRGERSSRCRAGRKRDAGVQPLRVVDYILSFITDRVWLSI